MTERRLTQRRRADRARALCRRRVPSHKGRMRDGTTGDETPSGLADRIVHEISRGMETVWPTTDRYAARLVDGLRQMRARDPRAVTLAIMRAPREGPIDWATLLSALVAE